MLLGIQDGCRATNRPLAGDLGAGTERRKSGVRLCQNDGCVSVGSHDRNNRQEVTFEDAVTSCMLWR